MSTYFTASDMLKPWKPLLQGIDHTTGFSEFAFGLKSHPRRQKVNAIRIDLTQPCIRFFTTPQSGIRDTTGIRLSDFLNGRPACVGINANFCSPDFTAYKDQFGTHPPEDKHSPGIPFTLIGLAVSEGRVVSSHESVPNSTYSGAGALMISRTNRASIASATAMQPPSSDVWTAVAGGPQPERPTTDDFAAVPRSTPTVDGPLLVVDSGQNMAKPAIIPHEAVAARTVVGLDSPGKTMYWLTIDDLDEYNPDAPDFDPETPQIGAAFYDIGEWMLALGAHIGLNLDGGKSSAMARTDLNGKAIVMSEPRPRPGFVDPIARMKCVGNYLGVQSRVLR